VSLLKISFAPVRVFDAGGGKEELDLFGIGVGGDYVSGNFMGEVESESELGGNIGEREKGREELNWERKGDFTTMTASSRGRRAAASLISEFPLQENRN